MCRRIVTSVINIILTLSCATYADAVIGDWEQQMDGWRVFNDNPDVVLSYDNIGVTNGTSSLRVLTDSTALSISLEDWTLSDPVAFRDMFVAHSYFSIDVTRLVSEWIPSADPNVAEVSLLRLCIMSETVSWTELDFAGFWSPEDGENPMTLTWDYSSIRDSIAAAGGPGDYLGFVISTIWDGYTPGGVYYFDNAQLRYVPEPATIALLALGGFTLIRRKR